MLAVATVVCTTMMAQTPNTITQQLYWLDGDISSAQTVTSTVDISGLLPGLHSCSIRVKDSEGLWSSIVTKYFVIPHYEPTATAITQREYCIDGNVAARTSLGESPAVISIGSLLPGLHSYSIRVKDDAGLWSSAVTKYFIIPSATESSSVAIARYMYWIDGDVANCVTGNVTGSAIGIDFSSLSEGTHTLSWQVGDTKGAWGRQVNKVVFNYTLPDSGLGTFSATTKLATPDGLDAYYCKDYDTSEGTIGVVAINGVVPAETGVLLRGEPGETYTLTTSNETPATVTDNALVAVTEQTTIQQTTDVNEVNYTNFGLSGGVFKKVNSAGGTVKANRAYLRIPTSALTPEASARGISLVWDEAS